MCIKLNSSTMAVGRYSMMRVKFPIRTALVWKLQSKSSHCVARLAAGCMVLMMMALFHFYVAEKPTSLCQKKSFGNPFSNL